MTSTSSTLQINPKFQKKQQIQTQIVGNSGLKLLKTNNRTYNVNYFLENEEKTQISLELPSTHTVSQAILSIVMAFNQKFKGFHCLKLNSQTYNLHFTKKNGNAKDDLPALDSGLLIGDVGVFVFCLKEKEKEEIVTSDDSDARSSIASANLSYQSPLKREIVNEKRDLKLENKSFWGFFLCRC